MTQVAEPGTHERDHRRTPRDGVLVRQPRRAPAEGRPAAVLPGEVPVGVRRLRQLARRRRRAEPGDQRARVFGRLHPRAHAQPRDRRPLRRADVRPRHGPRGDLGRGHLPPEPERSAVPVGRLELVRSGHPDRRGAGARRRRPGHLQPLARRLLLRRAGALRRPGPAAVLGHRRRHRGARVVRRPRPQRRQLPCARELRHGAAVRRRDGLRSSPRPPRST